MNLPVYQPTQHAANQGLIRRLARTVPLSRAEELVMNAKKTLWTVLLALLCVPASAVGIVLGFIVGCVVAMILVSIVEPGAGYDHYSVGTPLHLARCSY